MRPSAQTAHIGEPNVVFRAKYLQRLEKECVTWTKTEMLVEPSMRHIYAMQRANGDWFALDHKGRFGVPLFHSSRDALIARSRNWEMLAFKPVALNARLLEELIPLGGGSDVDFWLVNDPLISLNRGYPIQHAELASLIGKPIELQTAPRKGNPFETPSLSTLPQSDSSASETWEDEGGLHSKVA